MGFNSGFKGLKLAEFKMRSDIRCRLVANPFLGAFRKIATNVTVSFVMSVESYSDIKFYGNASSGKVVPCG